MNAESLRRTLEVGEAVYWSSSRQEFWHKGATSGHVQRVVEILLAAMRLIAALIRRHSMG